MSGSPIRLLVVEDHVVVREGLRALLANEPDLQVVGEAATADEAVAKVKQLAPDLVVMDVSLGSSNGIDAMERIRAMAPNTGLVVLTMHDDPKTVDRAVRAGARGYVVKGSDVRGLCEAIRQVARGQAYLSPEISQYLVKGYLARESDEDPLTDREREVLDLIAEGFTGREIADRLGLSHKTVENHRAHIMEKLDIHTTAGLVRYALSKA